MINEIAEGNTKRNNGQDEKEEFLKGTFFKLNLKQFTVTLLVLLTSVTPLHMVLNKTKMIQEKNQICIHVLLIKVLCMFRFKIIQNNHVAKH